MELKTNLGNAIRHRRLQLGLSQDQLARRMGPEIRQSDISRFEQGRGQFPRPQLLKSLAAALETTVIELMADAGWLTPEERAHYEHPPSGAEPSPTDSPTVIIASDNPMSTGALADLLSARSFRTVAAFDGRALVELVTSQRPAAVIVDQALPHLDLAGLSETIWQERLDTSIIVTGAMRPDLPAQAHFLPTPLDLQQLLQVLIPAGDS